MVCKCTNAACQLTYGVVMLDLIIVWSGGGAGAPGGLLLVLELIIIWSGADAGASTNTAISTTTLATTLILIVLSVVITATVLVMRPCPLFSIISDPHGTASCV